MALAAPVISTLPVRYFFGGTLRVVPAGAVLQVPPGWHGAAVAQVPAAVPRSTYERNEAVDRPEAFRTETVSWGAPLKSGATSSGIAAEPQRPPPGGRCLALGRSW
jgi:hypothetical protein